MSEPKPEESKSEESKSEESNLEESKKEEARVEESKPSTSENLSRTDATPKPKTNTRWTSKEDKGVIFEKKKNKGVLHTFMIKNLVDNPEGGVSLVGTFVQRVFDLTQKDVDNDFKFEYRVNGGEPTEEELNLRRIDPLDKSGRIVGTKSTYEAKLPLVIERLLSAFPFQISVARVTIALATSYDYRPIFYLSSNRRYLINIEDIIEESEEAREALGLPPEWFPDLLSRIQIYLGREDVVRTKSNIGRILDKIDQSQQYNFLSPHPMVSYVYDAKKEYSSRFTISIFLTTGGFEKWVQTVMPIILVTIISILNVWNDFYDVEVEDHLSITSALALTIVFILPQTLQRGKRKVSGEFFVIFFFVALILSSVPKGLAGTPVPEIVGVALMVGCVSFPFFNTIRFYFIQRKFIKGAIAQHKSFDHRFLDDETNRFWTPRYGKEELYLIKECVEGNFGKRLYRVVNSKRYMKHIRFEKPSKAKSEAELDDIFAQAIKKAKEKAESA